MNSTFEHPRVFPPILFCPQVPLCFKNGGLTGAEGSVQDKRVFCHRLQQRTAALCMPSTATVFKGDGLQRQKADEDTRNETQASGCAASQRYL